MLATVHQPFSHSPALSVLADQFGLLDAGLQEELAHCGVLTVKLDREVEVWLGVDQTARASKSSTSTKVLVVAEPPDVKQFCLEGFDIVLTWQEEHLEQLPHACLFVPATPWLVPAEWPQFHGDGAKRRGLAFLRGAKTHTEGHRLRHEVWAAREDLAARMQIPLDFEAGGVDRDARNRQFFSQFVLVVENSQHPNYFTEKLLDAMLARCVPVYWGCPNIASFFDADGVIEVQGGAAEVVAACLQLTESDFTSRSAHVDRNFELASQYAGDFGQRIQRALEQAFVARGTGE